MPNDHCEKCGISKTSILSQQAELQKLIRRAAPFVNAVACIAAAPGDGDMTPALAWLSDADKFTKGLDFAATKGDTP